MSRKIELLAPAKNLECGIAAISHGADAVYIGAARFGARADAGNSVDDIRELCRYAHTFGAKVYVTVNTIIYDNEMADTERLIAQLHDASVDAILVQDMGIVELNTLNMTLHASTQTDNRTAEKVLWLHSKGFSRVVLARELSAEEIKQIHDAVPDVELEVFVHGALCVSYSGLCYASQYCFGRSANRGKCAQFCRLKFDLEDSDGNVIEQGRHLLSLKDLCQIDELETLMQAGATSFKIEGRLKDATYVKNVTAAYSERLNEIISRHPERYHRASLGHCRYMFKPNLNKTFNRGFTHYFLNGRQADIASFDTPKAIGEYVGSVKEVRGGSFNVAGTASFANGDGLCFINKRRELEGFRVNRAEGNRIFPLKMPQNLRSGVALYRNNDQAFEHLLAHQSGERKIKIVLSLSETTTGFALSANIEGEYKANVSIDIEKQTAMKPQRENIVRQLCKLGNTPFECGDVRLIPADFNFFLPSSVLADMRRNVTEKLITTLQSAHDDEATNAVSNDEKGANVYPKHYSYLYNIANRHARKFYADNGLGDVQKAFELHQPTEKLLMQCRHCLRYSLGYCVKRGGRKPSWREPLYLRLADGRRFRLQFNCPTCQMNVYADE